MKPTEDLIREHTAIKMMLGIMKNIADKISDNRDFDAGDLERIVDFLRVFADRCHHGKEEDALFPALIAAGMARDSGPVAVMLNDHVRGRKYISDLETGIRNFRAGGSARVVEEALLSYVDLLRGHILKEEGILFPMADRLLMPGIQEEIGSKFERIEEEVIGPGVHEGYHELLDKLKRKYPG